MTKLDLKRNKLDHTASNELRSFIERIPGMTSVTIDPATGDIRAKSGVQVRLVISLEDQSPPDPNAEPQSPTAALFGEEETAGSTVDRFLGTGAGVTSQSKLQGPDAL